MILTPGDSASVEHMNFQVPSNGFMKFIPMVKRLLFGRQWNSCGQELWLVGKIGLRFSWRGYFPYWELLQKKSLGVLNMGLIWLKVIS
jgi:hypothetical protein